jgi:hypothetical protein
MEQNLKTLYENTRSAYGKIIKDEDCFPMSRLQEQTFVQSIINMKKEGLLTESTVTGDIAKYDPVLLSVIRRSMPNLIGTEIFGTQPMNAPTGLLFCIRSVYQNDSTNSVKRSNTIVLFLADGSYFTDGTAISTNGTGSGHGVVRYVEGNKVLVKVTAGTFAAGDAIDDADPFSSGVTTVSDVFANEAMYRYIFKDYAKFASVAASEVAGITQKEMGLEIDRTQVTADSYRLKAKYTDELAQDMKSQHNLDAETELIRILGNEISVEQNRKFIDYLLVRAAAGGSTNWNYASHAYGGDADGRWAAEKTFSFYQYINQVANQIAKTTLRGRGNFLIVSLDIASRLETLQHWKPADTISKGILDVDLGQRAFIGTLGGKYKVYVDLYATSDYVATGYKGPAEWDAGIYYAPYVPVYTKKTIDPETSQPVLFFHTRYGLADNPFGSELYYRLINVTL